MKDFDLADRDLVITADDDVSPKLPQVLDEVVGERVVVVEDEDHLLLVVRVHQKSSS
jgi:hypothetical protein